MLVLLLSGFLPVDDDLQLGEDAPHLGYDPATQAAYNAHALPFRKRWGRWHIRFDPRDGTPRALIGQGVTRSELRPLVEDVAAMAGVDPDTLTLQRHMTSDDRESWRFVQSFRGAPVEQGHLDVFAQNGRIHYLLSNLHRPRLGEDPEPGEVALWHEGTWSWVRREERDGLVTFTADGRLVHSYSLVFHLEVETEERTVGDPLILGPARGVRVSDDSSSEHTADDGSHGLSAPFDVELDGPFLSVYDNSPEPVFVEAVGDEVLDWAEDLSPAATTVLHHFHVVRDWLEDRRPSHPWLSENVPATVNLDWACCNAYYSGGSISFLVGSDEVSNLGRIADVVFHEYGHGVHHYVLEGGVFAGDISEGSADYVAGTVLDDPVLAPSAFASGGYIREIDTDRVYPDDTTGESHNDGLIWASFLWNLREQWAGQYTDGARMTDELFLQALSYGPTLTDVYEAVLVADDDNGDLSDGTPHACELQTLLAQHGLGPGPMGALVLDHEPLGPQSSLTETYPVSYELWNLTGDCGDPGPDDVGVYYLVDAEDPEAFEAYLRAEGDVIPRQFPGSHVRYFIRWDGADSSGSSHAGRIEDVYDFWVGDREALWCEGFEDGAGDWVFAATTFDGQTDDGWETTWATGEPGGQHFQPSSASEGAAVLGTNLEDDGQYRADNAEVARTPFVDLSEANDFLALLTMERHLSVEDGIYDRASVAAFTSFDEFETLWVNPSRDGTGHVLDADWRTFDLDLRDRSTDLLSFGWSLKSDHGLEFGGWTLDEVCVLTLADVPGHYRVRDLVASDEDPEVTIEWTNPYMEPLSATALVRNEDGIPGTLADGVIIDVDLGPEPGGARLVTDASLEQGEVAGYAVFVWQTDEILHEAVIEGDNGDWGGVPEPEDTAPPEDTAVPEDSEAPPREVVVDPEARCGCSPGGAGSSLLLMLVGVLLARRR